MNLSNIRKSFKGSGGMEFKPEEQPILCSSEEDDQNNARNSKAVNRDKGEAAEIIVNVDRGINGGSTKREQSFDFPQQRLEPTFVHNTPFTNKERVIQLNMHTDMDDARRRSTDSINLPPLAESPTTSVKASREIRVSFEPTSNSTIDPADFESIRRRCKEPSGGSARKDNAEVLRCTSNASFRRQTRALSKLKTRSRLLDPPEEFDRMSTRNSKQSGPVMSGMLGRVMEDEDDDPLNIDDLPDEYRTNKINTLTIAQWVGFFLILASLLCIITIEQLRKTELLDIHLWRWAVLLLVLICGRLVSGWGIRIIVFFVERNFILRKRVLYFVYGLRKGVQNCLWLGLVLLCWRYLFDKKINTEKRKKSHHFLNYVTKILICILVANLIWLVKTLFVKVLASSFHVSTYFDRIQESLFYQYVIGTLSGPPLIEISSNEENLDRMAGEVRQLQFAGATVPPDLRAAAFPQSCNRDSCGMQPKSFKGGKSFKFSQQFSRKNEKGKETDDGITIDHLHKLNTKNVSAWNMKRLIGIVRHGTLLTLDEQIGVYGVCEDEPGIEIRNENQATAAARKIFYNVAGEGSKYIYLDDLMRFMKDDEAYKTLSLFEGASESVWYIMQVNAFRERRALALTLNDTKTAVNKLHHLVNGVVGIVVLAVWLVILEIATSQFFVFVGSQLVVASFIFGNTVKTLFECIIFLFMVHPFDVGDRCEVESVQMIVEEMNILTTVFLRADNQKIVYPNSVLLTKPIGNYYRSPDMGDAVEFFVHIATPLEKINLMKQKIVSCIESRKEHWYPNPLVILKDQDDLTKLRVAVWFRHRINHQDMGEKWGRRALLLEEMVKIFKELDIQYRLHPVDVNLRTMPQNYNSSLTPASAPRS